MKYDDFDNRTYAKWTDVVTPVVATIADMRVEEMPRTKKKELVAYFPEEQFRFGLPITAKVNRRALAMITQIRVLSRIASRQGEGGAK
jgi:hypothetical protein